MVQRLRVEGHQLPVSAGLAIGHDDMGVQVRVAAPRGFMLVGDAHQARQALQVFVAGARVVHPRVAGVLVQVRQRRVHRGHMRLRHNFFRHVVGQRAQQRHTLRRGEHQVKAVHTVLGEGAPRRTVGGDPVIEPTRCRRGGGKPAIQCRTVETATFADRGLIADDHPRRGPRVALRIVFTQPTAGGLAIHRRLLGGIGGFVVVVDAPAAQPRDRQQPQPPPTKHLPIPLGDRGFGRASRVRNHSCTACANVPTPFWGCWYLGRLVLRWAAGEGIWCREHERGCRKMRGRRVGGGDVGGGW